ncbi:MAG: family 43 glycosylhydrolase [Enterococcus sp.]
MNPILPNNYYIPDVEAHKMPDGRVYIYGSKDNSGDTEFCSTEYYAFSTADMLHWENHGVIFNSTDKMYGLNTKLTLGAPDCLYINNRYYLYYYAYGNRMGVAVADEPTGPFQQLGSVSPADGESIDPAIFQDDDGSVYYFWGQFQLRGGRLAEDMKTVLPETIHENLLTEHEHGFHEGASIRKINETYYMVYTDISRGRATALGYATAKHPLGPYERQGIIIDNIGCDSETWNNHGSIEEFNGAYYVFYHRSSQNSIYNRRVCVEKITIEKDGTINEVEMTSNGASEALDATRTIPMTALSKMKVKLPFDHFEPMRLEPVGDEEALTYTRSDDWIRLDNLDFRTGQNQVTVWASSMKPAKIEIYGKENHLLGECLISTTDSWENYLKFDAPVEKIEGIQTIWLKICTDDNSVGRLANIKNISFDFIKECER